MPECVNGRHDLTYARMARWAAYQVTSTGSAATPQVPHRFIAFQEALPRFRTFQATTVAQSIACGYVTPLNGFGRLTTCAVQASADVESAWTDGRHGLDIRLVMIGHDCIGDHPGPLDGLAKERLGTGSVAVVTKEHIDDHAILVDGTIQVVLVSLAKQEHLVHEPVLANWTPSSTDLGGQSRPERLDPVQDRAMGHIDAALGQ